MKNSLERFKYILKYNIVNKHLVEFALYLLKDDFKGKPKKRKYRYKIVCNSPFADNDSDLKKITKVVDEEEFLKETNLIPILVKTRNSIFLDKYRDLNLFKGRKVAFVHMIYLTNIVKDIEEYYLESKTILKLTKQNN